MVSANHWFRGIKTYRLSWYLTRVSANHASSNWAQADISSCLNVQYVDLMNVHVECVQQRIALRLVRKKDFFRYELRYGV